MSTGGGDLDPCFLDHPVRQTAASAAISPATTGRSTLWAATPPAPTRVVPQWQTIELGDAIGLHPDVALTVAQVASGRVPVLRVEVPIGAGPAPSDVTWAFLLREGMDGTTRLVVRGVTTTCVDGRRCWSLKRSSWSAPFSQQMLRGTRDRVEGTQSAPTKTDEPGRRWSKATAGTDRGKKPAADSQPTSRRCALGCGYFCLSVAVRCGGGAGGRLR